LRLFGRVSLAVNKRRAETCYRQEEIETDLTLSCAELNEAGLCNGLVFRKRRNQCRKKNYNSLPIGHRRFRPRWCPLLRR